MAKSKKPKSRQQLFMEWVESEGRKAELDSRWDAMMLEKPMPTAAQCLERCILEFGWTVPSAEELANAVPVMTYEQAVEDLPTQTPKGVSAFAWIASHPKMPGAHEKTNRTVVITGADVLNAPCGPAPSKEAANALRQYANAPDLFWKAWSANQAKLEAKIVADAAEAEVEVDEGLPDVERLLGSVLSRRKE